MEKLKKRLRLIPVIIITVGLFYISFKLPKEEASEQVALNSMKSITEIINHEKITAKPSNYNNNQVLSVTLIIESYQDLNETSPLERTFLTDQNKTPYQPINWQITKESLYSIEGILTFNIDLPNTKSLKLHYFNPDEIIFNWDEIKR